MSTSLEQERSFVAPNTKDPDSRIRTHYTFYYKDVGRDRRGKMRENKDDSPDQSRKSLIHEFRT